MAIARAAEGPRMSTELRFTTRDVELLAEDGKRYEIIDGELYVSAQPHWRHQRASGRFFAALDAWCEATEAGLTIEAPGVIFAEDEAVAPDIVWISRERVDRVVGEDGKLHLAPDLIVEILSPGTKNEERDRDAKLKLYSRRGVREYWIADWREVSVQVYRRVNATLRLVATFTPNDLLTSPMLPGFSSPVRPLLTSRLGPSS
jgi:Uma2 family endonuclease